MKRIAVVALLALVLGTAVVGPGASETADSTDHRLVSVGDARIWPYLSSTPSFDRRASPINVVVRDDPESVRRYLTRQRGWNRTDTERAENTPNQSAVVPDEHVPWRDAPGATRYVYVADRGWLTERYQLHRGAYFGARHHLRAYGPREGNWTAVQAHTEHWDWFTITHTVDSVEDAQQRAEATFLGERGFGVRRTYYDNGDAYDADGWTTVVVVALAPLLARRRVGNLAERLGALVTVRNRRRVTLVGVLAALPLVVRFGAVFCEQYLPWLSPNVVVATWYPVLVAGVPLAAYGFGRRLPAAEAGGLAALGVGTGIVLDYAAVGVAVLPIPVAAHRTVAVVAVGLLAAGAGETGTTSDRSPSRDGASTPGSDAGRRTALVTGAALWVVVVVAGHLV